MFLITLLVLVTINAKLLKELQKIHKGVNSYQYLTEFNQWIKKQIAINKNIATFMYPTIMLSMFLGFWFKNAEGMPLGERLVGEFLIRFPDMYMIYGVPLTGIVLVSVILSLLAFFGGRIYLWDLNIVYGRVFQKLDELLADLETLRF